MAPKSFSEIAAHAESSRKLTGGDAATALAKTITALYNRGLATLITSFSARPSDAARCFCRQTQKEITHECLRHPQSRTAGDHAHESQSQYADPAVTGPRSIALKAGTTVAGDGLATAYATTADVPIAMPDLSVGGDYAIFVAANGALQCRQVGMLADLALAIGGFHFAPGSNAPARAGGDDAPAINPCSCWDLNFRPACADPRGMTYIAAGQVEPFWADIYLLGVDHDEAGTSRFGVTIADGVDKPFKADDGRTRLTAASKSRPLRLARLRGGDRNHGGAQQAIADL